MWHHKITFYIDKISGTNVFFYDSLLQAQAPYVSDKKINIQQKKSKGLFIKRGSGPLELIMNANLKDIKSSYF